MIDPEGASRFFEIYDVPRETMDRLVLFSELVERENLTQNLVSSSTLSTFWDRHVLDSAQLVALAPRREMTWLDVGSGAGLPGIVTALLTQAPHILVEPRRRRAEFLNAAVDALGLADRARVICARIENLTFKEPCLITARAFSSLTNTLGATFHLSSADTTWLLHKGRVAQEELREARHSWSGRFELFPSVTATDAKIVRLSDVTRCATL